MARFLNARYYLYSLCSPQVEMVNSLVGDRLAVERLVYQLYHYASISILTRTVFKGACCSGAAKTVIKKHHNAMPINTRCATKTIIKSITMLGYAIINTSYDI